MHLLRKLRVIICVAFVSLLFLGNPICLTINCEDGKSQLEIKEGLNASDIRAAVEKCKPAGLTCEKIWFSSLLPPFSMETLKMRISAPFAFFALFGLFQLVVLLCGASSKMNKSQMFWGYSYLDCLYCFEMSTFLVPSLYALADGLNCKYVDFASQYRADYFSIFMVLYVLGAFSYLVDVSIYFIEELTNQDRNEQEQLLL